MLTVLGDVCLLVGTVPVVITELVKINSLYVGESRKIIFDLMQKKIKSTQNS